MTGAVTLPAIIQGGMGVGVSNWVLARAVASRGHLGVVSGTCLDTLFVRRLADGDAGGHLRRAIDAFPIPGVGAAVLDRYFRPGGRSPGEPYPSLPMFRQTMKKSRLELTLLANFVEVYLAREGHDGRVGINLLTKVAMPNLPSLYGAMLAGVDAVLMGAGIPREIPGCLDRLAGHEPASMRFEVSGPAGDSEDLLRFDPGEHWEGTPPAIERPAFLAIVASNSLATMLVRKANGRVDGLVIEGPTAGGHNAPPRGRDIPVNDRGEPIYGERDDVDLAGIAELGVPFWLAGGAGRPGRLAEAQAAGARGIQVGTLFAYCEESGLRPTLKRRVIDQSKGGGVDVLTDTRASPTGFPFKVVQLRRTLSGEEAYRARTRVCDLGYLRTAYRKEDGRVDYRCPAEPIETYVKKDGVREDAEGRKCLCNALMANLGHGQVRSDDVVEQPLLTSGDDVRILGSFLAGRRSYTAADVIDYLLAGTESPVPAYASASQPK
ncbi:MAG: nitronate monooxygenase [Gemmatimonadota bacterium]